MGGTFLSVVLGIDPSVPPGRRIAVRRSVRGVPRVVSQGNEPLREKPNQVVLSVPSEFLTFRTLSVPFTDRKRAEDVARQELANSLPMPLSEVRWSLCMLEKHQYLAVVSPRRRLDQLTESLAGPPPDIVDAEPFSYARALASQDVRDGLVVDMDAHRTIFCLVRAARPVFVRVLLRGGDSVGGLRGPDLRAGLERLLADALLPTLDADIGVFVAGRAASVSDLATVLNETLQRPVRPFPMPDGLSADTDVGAFGAALRTGADDGVDLMRHRPSGRPVWIRYCLAAAVLLALVTLDLAVRQMEARQRATTTLQALTQLLQTQAPGVPDVATLKSKVDAAAGQTASGPAQNLLDVLKNVALKSTHRNVRLQEVHFGQGHTELDGWAASFNEEEGLQKDLATVYKDVKAQDVHTTQDNRVHFKVRLGAPQ
jgi:hypothetical protein